MLKQEFVAPVPSVYLGLKLLGGLYLCYLGFRIFAAGGVALTVEGPGQSIGTLPARSLWLGLTRQVSNPKTAIVSASVLAAFLPGTFSLLFAAVLLCGVFVVEAGWYAVVAAVLSSSRPGRAYLSYKGWVDRTGRRRTA